MTMRLATVAIIIVIVFGVVVVGFSFSDFLGVILNLYGQPEAVQQQATAQLIILDELTNQVTEV